MGMNLHLNLLEQRTICMYIFTLRAVEFTQLNEILLECICKQKQFSYDLYVK